MGDTRRHERAAVSLWQRHRTPTEIDYRETACLDLSPGGMFIESRTPAKPGTLVKLVCRGDCGTFRALGHVAWNRTDDGSAPSGMGIRFLELDPHGPDVVEGMLASARLTAAARALVEEERSSRAIALAGVFATLLAMFALLLAA